MRARNTVIVYCFTIKGLITRANRNRLVSGSRNVTSTVTLCLILLSNRSACPELIGWGSRYAVKPKVAFNVH